SLIATNGLRGGRVPNSTPDGKWAEMFAQPSGLGDEEDRNFPIAPRREGILDNGKPHSTVEFFNDSTVVVRTPISIQMSKEGRLAPRPEPGRLLRCERLDVPRFAKLLPQRIRNGHLRLSLEEKAPAE